MQKKYKKDSYLKRFWCTLHHHMTRFQHFLGPTRIEILEGPQTGSRTLMEKWLMRERDLAISPVGKLWRLLQERPRVSVLKQM